VARFRAPSADHAMADPAAAEPVASLQPMALLTTAVKLLVVELPLQQPLPGAVCRSASRAAACSGRVRIRNSAWLGVLLEIIDVHLRQPWFPMAAPKDGVHKALFAEPCVEEGLVPVRARRAQAAIMRAAARSQGSWGLAEIGRRGRRGLDPFSVLRFVFWGC